MRETSRQADLSFVTEMLVILHWVVMAGLARRVNMQQTVEMLDYGVVYDPVAKVTQANEVYMYTFQVAIPEFEVDLLDKLECEEIMSMSGNGKKQVRGQDKGAFEKMEWSIACKAHNKLIDQINELTTMLVREIEETHKMGKNMIASEERLNAMEQLRSREGQRLRGRSKRGFFLFHRRQPAPFSE